MQQPQATKNNVIIQPFLEKSRGEEGYTTAGGIYIPQKVEEYQADKVRVPFAMIVAVGPGVDEVKVGDEIFYNKAAAKHLGPGYEEFFSININEVMGVVTREA